MLACLDVHYRETCAIAACVLFQDWPDPLPASEHIARIEPVAPYIPGQFFRRELPCLLHVLRAIPRLPDLLLIDGYVWLDAVPTPGLGAHLFDALHRQIPIIGVAKTRFHTAIPLELPRPGSTRPLYITAVGLAPAAAADCIRRMHGAHRIPTLLKRADTLCRQA